MSLVPFKYCKSCGATLVGSPSISTSLCNICSTDPDISVSVSPSPSPSVSPSPSASPSSPYDEDYENKEDSLILEKKEKKVKLERMLNKIL